MCKMDCHTKIEVVRQYVDVLYSASRLMRAKNLLDPQSCSSSSGGEIQPRSLLSELGQGDKEALRMRKTIHLATCRYTS